MGSVASRCPTNNLAPAALLELDQAITLYQSASEHPIVQKALVSLPSNDVFCFYQSCILIGHVECGSWSPQPMLIGIRERAREAQSKARGFQGDVPAPPGGPEDPKDVAAALRALGGKEGDEALEDILRILRGEQRVVRAEGSGRLRTSNPAEPAAVDVAPNDGDKEVSDDAIYLYLPPQASTTSSRPAGPAAPDMIPQVAKPSWPPVTSYAVDAFMPSSSHFFSSVNSEEAFTQGSSNRALVQTRLIDEAPSTRNPRDSLASSETDPFLSGLSAPDSAQAQAADSGGVEPNINHLPIPLATDEMFWQSLLADSSTQSADEFMEDLGMFL